MYPLTKVIVKLQEEYRGKSVIFLEGSESWSLFGLKSWVFGDSDLVPVLSSCHIFSSN